MKDAPSFWHRPNATAYLFFPLSCLYLLAGKIRGAITKSYVAPVPVICVGNVVAGGAGKTPFVIALAVLLREKGIGVHVVTRGYGGEEYGPLRVDLTLHNAPRVGDEPLLIANHAPCWVAKRRTEGVKAAMDAGAELILLDDGLQNPSIHKSLSFMVVDGGYGVGNGLVMPAGPLRETVASALRKTDAVILVGEDRKNVSKRFSGTPLFHAAVQPVNPKSLYDRRFIAFAGIGRPEKFFETLREQGAIVEQGISFPDHHTYSEDDLLQLEREAKKYQIELITTEKDYVRLSNAWREKISVLPITLKIFEQAALENLLAPFIAGGTLKTG